MSQNLEESKLGSRKYKQKYSNILFHFWFPS